MRHTRSIFYVCAALMMILAACTVSSAPSVVTEPPLTSAPATSAPAQTAASAPIATSTATAINLAGPPMQVGSTYLYFDGSTLVAVPGGPFVMGHGGSDNPEHTVTLDDFWIYSTEVTNREYQQCVTVGKCTPPDLTDNQGYTDFTRQSDPVVGVTYDQSSAYCDYAHGNLPTEAQWEKVARGPNGNIYPWGNNAPGNDLLNYNNDIGRTTNVINYPKGKSYYDALDMEGNVYEWVADWYAELYYSSSPAQNPLGPDLGNQRSVRSSSYKTNINLPQSVAASTRYHRLPTDHARDLGFRCVVKDPFYFAPMCQVTAYVGGDLSGGAAPASNAPIQPALSNNQPALFGCPPNAGASITFNDSLGTDPNANLTGPGNCSIPGGNSYPKTVMCMNVPDAGLDLNFTSACQYPSAFTPSCPAHYNLSGGVCVWDGSGTAGTQCPAGTVYDPTNKCCTSTPGTGTNFNACPSGWFFQVIGGVNECVPDKVACNVSPDPVHVDQNVCGGNPGGGNCNYAALCKQKCPTATYCVPDTSSKACAVICR
jgi:sulfatase modifying factor 1